MCVFLCVCLCVASSFVGGSGSCLNKIQIRMPNDRAAQSGVTLGAKQTSCYGSAQYGPNLSEAVTAELWARRHSNGYN